jgi:hypothetical protein
MSPRKRIYWMSPLLLALLLAGCATTTSAPAPVAAAAKPHSVIVTWEPSKSKVSGYNVYRIIDETTKPKLLTTTKPDVTRYEDKDTEIEPGKTYTYSVRSLSPDGKIESLPVKVTVTIPTN